MSVTLIKELCWVAAAHAEHSNFDEVEVGSSHSVRLIGNGAEFSQCFSGNLISMDGSIEEAEQADAFFISAFWGDPAQTIAENKLLLPMLEQLHEKAIPIAAVSNAPFFLAEAGLLNDKMATIYPPLAARFRRDYPQVNLHFERAITDAGHLYCANGIASGCDLTVAIIEQLYGSEIAGQIRDEFLIGFNRNYSLIGSMFDGQKYHRDQQILSAQQWLEQNFYRDIVLSDLAVQMGMSPRNFSRRFKQATGDTPSLYLQRVRIEVAKELLGDTNLPIAEVAYRVGYNDLSYFARLFKRHQGCLPHHFG